MATTAERLGIVETKVVNLDEKIDNLKIDVKEMHDCLDQTRDKVMEQLSCMQKEYRESREGFYKHANDLHAEDTNSHKALAAKIEDLEKQKHKAVMYAMVALAFAAGAGWSGHLNFPMILKFLGI